MTWNRNRSLLAATAAILLVAAIAYRSLRSEETVSDREVIQALGDSTYTVRCDGCGQVYMMPAADFTRGLASVGPGEPIKCIKCGQRKASRDEVVQGHPLLQDFDTQKYVTSNEIRAAIDKINEQIISAQTRLAEPEIDQTQRSALEHELKVLHLQRSALDLRWDELEAQQHSS
jgi:NAD-dependent SIR2 family protein deacetylase